MLSDNKRHMLTDDDYEVAVNLVTERLHKARASKGDGAFISLSEAFGKLSEEFHEVLEEKHHKRHGRFNDEMLDIAVIAIFAIASRNVMSKR